MAFLGTAAWAEKKAEVTGDARYKTLKASADKLHSSFDIGTKDAMSYARQIVRSEEMQNNMECLITAFNDVLSKDESDPDRSNKGLRTSIRRIAKFRDGISDAGSGCDKVVRISTFDRPYSEL